MRAITRLAIGLMLSSLAVPALAGGWGGRYGVQEQQTRTWSYQATQSGCACAWPRRPPAAVSLPGSFFEGYGGVGGFEEVDYGGGGGGFATAASSAGSFASAFARVSVKSSVHVGVHGGHGGHGCGCK